MTKRHFLFGLGIAALLIFPLLANAQADEKQASVVASSKDDEVFEKKLRDLMYVAINDIRPACWHTREEKIDLAAEKKYFTDKGWNEYQQYVNQVKRQLIKGFIS